MKKALPVLVIAALAIIAIVIAAKRNQQQDMATSTAGGGSTTQQSSEASIVWYGMMPHPYINEVEKGAMACAKDFNVQILSKKGLEWTQDDETKNITSLSTMGYKGFSIFPGDPTGANGLFQKLKDQGQYIVAYGAVPTLPTPASFTVATDIPAAARDGCEKLIQTMGDKGNILDVLETLTDVNTKIRQAAVEEVVAKHPNVHIIQTINDMTTQDKAMAKIQDTMAAQGDQIDGIIATGYNPTVAAALLLEKWNANTSHKHIHFVGIDTADAVIAAIRDGSIDGTVAQNPFAHGYVSCALLKYIVVDGYKPAADYAFIDAGDLVVTKDNIDSYPAAIKAKTDAIMKDLTTKYLKK